MTASATRVDHSALRTNQAGIVSLGVLAFVLNQPLLVAFVAAVLAAGTIWPAASLFKSVYTNVLKPAGLVKPDVRDDDPAQHRFAQGMGAVVLALATASLLAHALIVGWVLTWLVVALAALNLFFGICVGCLIYAQLARAGVVARS
jgi:hypothetical protein